ncbi:hypothetical protein RB195_009793 [Necator americanus]|uniref:Uncharacterized protein n=1 Tax=Necator americanus TaxID=51031 RepID=A0ABR1CV05_NECAM
MQCGDEYVRDTGRPLCVRVGKVGKEHLNGKAKSRDSTAFGCHRLWRYDGEDFEVRITIVPRESSASVLDPFQEPISRTNMNVKEEWRYITRKLAP